jgi:hypothetical protein
MSEQPRPEASTDEHSFLLSVKEAADRYAAAGHPRTIRAIQKYCGRLDLECQKVETTYGERYLITPASIDRHIAMIIERSQTNVPERPRPDATVRPSETGAANTDERFASGREQRRPDAGTELAIFQHPYVRRLKAEVDDFKSKYEKQVRRTEEILEDANKRLVEMARPGQIAGSKTLAEYLLVAKTPPPTPVVQDGDKSVGRAGLRYNVGMVDRSERHIGDILKERNIEIIGADPVTRHGFTQVPNFVLPRRTFRLEQSWCMRCCSNTRGVTVRAFQDRSSSPKTWAPLTSVCERTSKNLRRADCLRLLNGGSGRPTCTGCT